MEREVERAWQKVGESDRRAVQLELRRRMDGLVEESNERTRAIKRAFLSTAQDAGSLTFRLGYKRIAQMAGYKESSAARNYVERNLLEWVDVVESYRWFGRNHPDNRETLWRLR